MTVRVSGGDLCEAEAPTEAAAETKDASKMSAQSEERDLISGSLIIRSHLQQMRFPINAIAELVLLLHYLRLIILN